MSPTTTMRPSVMLSSTTDAASRSSCSFTPAINVIATWAATAVSPAECATRRLMLSHSSTICAGVGVPEKDGPLYLAGGAPYLASSIAARSPSLVVPARLVPLPCRPSTPGPRRLGRSGLDRAGEGLAPPASAGKFDSRCLSTLAPSRPACMASISMTFSWTFQA